MAIQVAKILIIIGKVRNKPIKKTRGQGQESERALRTPFERFRKIWDLKVLPSRQKFSISFIPRALPPVTHSRALQAQQAKVEIYGCKNIGKTFAVTRKTPIFAKSNHLKK